MGIALPALVFSAELTACELSMITFVGPNIPCTFPQITIPGTGWPDLRYLLLVLSDFAGTVSGCRILYAVAVEAGPSLCSCVWLIIIPSLTVIPRLSLKGGLSIYPCARIKLQYNQGVLVKQCRVVQIRQRQ